MQQDAEGTHAHTYYLIWAPAVYVPTVAWKYRFFTMTARWNLGVAWEWRLLLHVITAAFPKDDSKHKNLWRCLLLQCIHNLWNTTHTNSIARLRFWLKSETWFCTSLLTSAALPCVLSRIFSPSWSQWGLVWTGSVPHNSSSARASLETLVSWGNVARWPTCTRQGVPICDMQLTNHRFEQSLVLAPRVSPSVFWSILILQY